MAALAVASEPEIFWNGSGAEAIINKIKIPPGLGKLVVPSNKKLNGPSGSILDEQYLDPLGLDRQNTWLCDLLPESRVNEKQRAALEKHYTPLFKNKKVSEATIPDFKKKDLNSEKRRKEILKELEISQADTLILLGDLPIRWFLHFYDKRFSRLSDFMKMDAPYGKPNSIDIKGKSYNVIALCHPRQAGKLGASSSKWGELHKQWIEARRKK